MSDTNKFVNAYIDVAVNQVHEYLNTVLQLKAQLKTANDLVTEKDGIISQLSQQLESNKIENEMMTKLRNDAKRWEDAHNAVMGKASHLDTALAQIAEMKKEIALRNDRIADLEKQLSDLRNPIKKQINKKKNTDKSVSIVIEEPVVQTASIVRKSDDDF